MNKRKAPIYGRLLLAGLTAAASPFAAGQDEVEKEIFELSPFTIDASKDEGYRASQTLAGGRINTDIKDIGSSIEVLTKDFMDDIGASDLQEMMQYTTGGEVGGEQGNFIGTSADPSKGDINNVGARRDPDGNARVRGLGRPDQVRNYFQTSIPLDSYNVERVDINRGSNSFLFGLGSPAGLINSQLARARFRESTAFTFGIGSGGDDPSIRANIDINRVLKEDVLAVRLMALRDDKNYRQNPTYKQDERFYGAFTLNPFGNKTTTIRGHIESGVIEGNPVDTLLPKQSFDSFVQLRLPIDVYDNIKRFGNSAGPDQEQWDALSPADQARYYVVNSQGAGVLDRTGAWGYNIVYDGSNGSDAGWWYQSDFSNQMYLQGNSFWDPVTDDDVFGSAPLSQTYKNAQYLNGRGPGWTQYGFTNLDSFDFTKQLFAGESDYIRTDLQNYNLSIEQIFLEGNAGIEIGFDSQETTRTAFTNFTGWNGQFEIDINQTLLLPTLDANGNIATDANGNALPIAQANPNFGRPFFISNSNRDNRIEKREAARMTGYFSHDFTKRDHGLLKWFGKHSIAALVDDYKEEYRSFNDQLSNFSDDFNLGWHIGHSGAHSPTHTYRRTASIVYLGPAIQSYINDPFNPATPLTVGDIRIEASDYNLLIDEPFTRTMTYWSRGADAEASLDINGNAPSSPNYIVGQEPGNYLTNGDEQWKQGTVTNQWIPTTNNTARLTEIRSWAINDQSKFFGDHLVVNVGYREDVVKNWLNSQTKQTSDGIPVVSREDFTYLDGKYTEVDKGPSGEGVFGYGGVLHMPRELLKFPRWFDFSTHYNFSKNFVPDATRESFREGSDGIVRVVPVPSPEGEGKDYGVTFRLFEDKVIARLNWYESSELNSQNGLGNLFNRFLGQTHRFYDETQRDRIALDKDGDGKLDIIPSKNKNMTDEEYTHWFYPNFDRAMDANVRLKSILDQGYLQAEIDAGKTSLKPDGTLTTVQPWLPNLHDTQDVASEGFEANITYNPVRNWRIQLNAAKTKSTTANVGPSMTRIVDQILPIYLDISDMSYWDPSRRPSGLLVSGGRVGGDIRDYFKIKMLQGQDNPEVREWRFNAVTNYSFQEGFLKGFQIGGAARWQSSGVIGYELMDFAVDANDPTQTILINNLDAPFYSDEQVNIDLKLGYRKKIRDGKVNWDIRLNVKNLNNFNSDELSTIAYQPDGTVARVRFNPPLTWELTNSFRF